MHKPAAADRIGVRRGTSAGDAVKDADLIVAAVTAASSLDAAQADIADAERSAARKVPVGSEGFVTRSGGWQTLETRTFSQMRMKAFMKAQF